MITLMRIWEEVSKYFPSARDRNHKQLHKQVNKCDCDFNTIDFQESTIGR